MASIVIFGAAGRLGSRLAVRLQQRLERAPITLDDRGMRA